MNIRIWEDIGYAGILDKSYEYVWEYKVYKVSTYDTDGKPCFHRRGSPTWPDPVGIEESEVYLEGSVKWDGCSNWRFVEQDRVMLHGCSKQDLLNMGEVMARCWAWTKEEMSRFDGEEGLTGPQT